MTSQSYLLNLPDEVLLQVLSTCDPAGLLQLSRSCTLLRSLLTDPEYSSVWAASRTRIPKVKCRTTRMFPFGVSISEDVEIPFPQRLSNLSEQAFARLMCEPACTMCAMKNATPYPGLQRRLCLDCLSTHCFYRNELPDIYEKEPPDAAGSDGVDFTTWLASVRQHCSKQYQTRDNEIFWKDDVLRHSQDLARGALEPKADAGSPKAVSNQERQKFERSWRDWIDASQAVQDGERSGSLVPIG